jgi:hypothetical protein
MDKNLCIDEINSTQAHTCYTLPHAEVYRMDIRRFEDAKVGTEDEKEPGCAVVLLDAEVPTHGRIPL